MGLTVYGGGGKPEEEKTVTAGTSTIEVNPSSGKVMKKVTVNPTPTESKSVTPTTSELTVTPSEGKHLAEVVVAAIEDVTPEVTAQTPVITQIAENLGVTITTPSGTNKQILQGNNANLLNIKNNAKKEGQYVWKKLTAEGGNFVDFVVSDNESAYPDGGEQGGYWYEKFQLDPTLFGCTKYVVDKFTLTSDAVASNNYIPHSLGVVPLFALFITTDASTVHDSYIKYAIIIGGNGKSPNIGLYAYRDMQTNNGYYGTTNIFEDKLRINYGRTSYKAGVEYTLITMA